jgi:hypothetical protein
VWTETAGYYFWPYFNIENKIIALNEGNTIFNHTLDNGNLQLTFERAGTGDVTSVIVSSYLRHLHLEQAITMSYADVKVSGGHGNWSEYPNPGETLNCSWNGVDGEFDVVFSGGADVTFTLGGIAYVANLSNGSVTLASD